jgi:glucosamine-6-phosphate deaminase
MRTYNAISHVEKRSLSKGNQQFRYSPIEKINIIEVPDFPSLGKISALRFLEWVQLNPEGVVALPTGKTPEYFIKWTSRYLTEWTQGAIQKELDDWGLDITKKPNVSSLRFVQIDEFYPMNPLHENSFAYYIEHFYFKGFGLRRQLTSIP